MQENILETYKKILDLSLEVQAAVKEKDWELVNILVSKREEHIQKTNAFVMNNKNIDEELKKSIKAFLIEIKSVDDASFEVIKEDKAAMQIYRQKLSKGQKALNAYQTTDIMKRGSMDRSL